VSTFDPVQLLAARAASQLAVLVIDVQSGLFNTKPPPFEADEVIHRINFVTGRARSAGVPVFFVQHDGLPEGDWLVPFSDGWQLHADLSQASDDHFIRKTTGDCFYGTNLERQLRGLGVQSLILTGYATEFCVDSTLRNAVSKEFEIFVVADAHTTNDTALLKAAIIRQYFNWVWGESSSARGIHQLNAADVRFSVPNQAVAAG
jgi:nicotinamidase-related amidase